MAKQFLMLFEGRAEDGIDWKAGMQIQGDRDYIGKLLAEFIYREWKNGEPAPMKIFAEMVARLEQLDPGASKESRIIIP